MRWIDVCKEIWLQMDFLHGYSIVRFYYKK